MLDLSRKDLLLEDIQSTLVPIAKKFEVKPASATLMLRAMYRSSKNNGGKFSEIFEARDVGRAGYGNLELLLEDELVIEENDYLRLTEKAITILSEAANLQKKLYSSKCRIRLSCTQCSKSNISAP